MCCLVALQLGKCEGGSDEVWDVEGGTDAGLDTVGWEPPFGSVKQELSEDSVFSLVTAEALYYNIQ